MKPLLSAVKKRLLPAGPKPRRIRTGAFRGLTMNLDLHTQTQVWLGLAEREVFPYLARFLEHAVTALDVGAAEGEYTLAFLARPGVRRVYAFDPAPWFPAACMANLALNGLDRDPRVTLVPCFVGDRDGDHDGDRWCTLDAAAPDAPGPCLIKIDVDGGEESVLRGAGRFLDRPDTSWIIETHSADLERICQSLLHARGFTTAVIRNAWWRLVLPEQRPSPQCRWLAAWRGPAAALSRPA